jgi:hypothetical protein
MVNSPKWHQQLQTTTTDDLRQPLKITSEHTSECVSVCVYLTKRQKKRERKTAVPYDQKGSYTKYSEVKNNMRYKSHKFFTIYISFSSYPPAQHFNLCILRWYWLSLVASCEKVADDYCIRRSQCCHSFAMYVTYCIRLTFYIQWFCTPLDLLNENNIKYNTM